MFERLRRDGVVTAVLALVVAVLGTVPALAEGEPTYLPADAMLTKVIVAPADTDASGDSYVFHFAGGGEVVEQKDDQDFTHVYSDGIEQDTATIKAGDIVPAIGDVTLTGVKLTADNSLTNGQMSQAVVRKPLSEVLSNVTFPHAGVYTYVVTERSATTKLTDGTYINASKAEYTLRIRVKNSNTGSNSALGNEDLTIESVTVEQKKDDNGNTLDNALKVDPTYPKTDDNGKITNTAENTQPAANTLAGDANGCNVPGFTFGNVYIKGGPFQVKKLYDGDHSDRTNYSLVELTVYSEAAASSCLTYRIEGEGIDETEYNQDNNGEHVKLNGIRSDITQNNDYMATFNDKGWVTIKAELKEGSVIRITGEFGPYDAAYENDPANPDHNRRKILSASGLLHGQTYYVIEKYPGNYAPTGYVYVGEDASADPRKNPSGMTEKEKLSSNITDPTDFIPKEYENNPDSYQKRTIEKGCLLVQGDTTGSATTVFVVNTLDGNKVAPTGILIDNLPYILMVGIPVAVFAGMFVMKRRRNAAA